MATDDAVAATIQHEREGGSTPVRCRGCKRPWPCDDAVIMPLKPYTRYICPNDTGHGGHSSHWTGIRNPAVSTTRDGYCMGCGAVMVEEVKDGTRWRVEFEADTGFGWHNIVNETESERDARSQVIGLRQQEAEGEPVRFIGLSKSGSAWEAVDA
jgi:hypothetical protein